MSKNYVILYTKVTSYSTLTGAQKTSAYKVIEKQLYNGKITREEYLNLQLTISNIRSR